jgi:hypothetical protein
VHSAGRLLAPRDDKCDAVWKQRRTAKKFVDCRFTLTLEPDRNLDLSESYSEPKVTWVRASS